MKSYFVSFSITGPQYLEFLNEEVEVENHITSMDDISDIEDQLRISLIENEIIPKDDADMYNINILFWKAFDND